MHEHSYFIVGGAGFIGSHFVDQLLASEKTRRVTVYDNFSSGQRWHLEQHASDQRLAVVAADVHDRASLREAMLGHHTVIHLASNPDIARAVTEPDIDFRAGTELTSNVVEAMRQTGARAILYASGSGVYGEIGQVEAHEDYGPLIPISTYGASKLAGESLLAAYSYMFDMRARAFRFGNVVGRRQTHGVGYDFIRQLRRDPTTLRILGDGTQSKSYIYVSDVVEAVLLAHGSGSQRYDVFNVATGDYIRVTEIADVACTAIGLDPANVRYVYAGGDRGWKGDVPIVRLSIEKIRALGWRPTRTSGKALADSMEAMLEDLRRAPVTKGELG